VEVFDSFPFRDSFDDDRFFVPLGLTGITNEMCYRSVGSVAEQPNSRSALVFQLAKTPVNILLTMASSDESTIAASKPIA
jgi:hypothetical protein